jgi:hypothetical protein
MSILLVFRLITQEMRPQLIALPSQNPFASITVYPHSIYRRYLVDPYEIEDTSDWLGCPTELETCRHYLRLLENEVQELNLQLRMSRETIFGLVKMYDDASAQRDEAMSNLRERSGELAMVRKQLYDLDIISRGHKREADRLRGILNGLTPNSKTII